MRPKHPLKRISTPFRTQHSRAPVRADEHAHGNFREAETARKILPKRSNPTPEPKRDIPMLLFRVDRPQHRVRAYDHLRARGP